MIYIATLRCNASLFLNAKHARMFGFSTKKHVWITPSIYIVYATLFWISISSAAQPWEAANEAVRIL